MSIYQSKGLLNCRATFHRLLVIMLYNVRGFPTFISMDIHPSDIPCCMPHNRCRQEPSAPTFLLSACLYLCLQTHISILYLKKHPEQTYEAQSALHSAFNHILGSSKGNWLIPALHIVCRNTHRAAVLADEAVSVDSGKRNDHAKLQNAVTLLQASYSKTLNDRTDFKVRY